MSVLGVSKLFNYNVKPPTLQTETLNSENARPMACIGILKIDWTEREAVSSSY
jgi:hypothetical protein